VIDRHALETIRSGVQVCSPLRPLLHLGKSVREGSFPESEWVGVRLERSRPA
jgi:hypothetical protein